MEDERLSERVAKIEGILEQVDKRLNHFGEHLLRHDDKFDELIKATSSQFKWLVGIILGTILPMWITIILAILITRGGN